MLIPVSAVEAGTGSNVAANTVSLMMVPNKNVTEINNPEPIRGGTERETDDDFYDRIAAEYDNSMTYLGNDTDYKRWAKQAGAGDAIVIPAWNGPGTVKLVLVDGNGKPANAKLVQDVYNYIVSPNDRSARLLPTGTAELTCAATTVAVNYVITGLSYNETIEKLQDKVDGLREDQERMKQANKAIRMKDKEKGDATLHDMGYTDEQIAQLREPDFCGRIGFPDYMLTNNNANIRRLEGRIKSLQKTKSQGTQESENKFFKVKENVEAMRIQLFFEGKPEPEVRDILKSNGFRWAPSVGAWQRQLNNNGKYAVERVIRELEEMEAAE